MNILILQLQTEIDAAYLYEQLAAKQKDETARHILEQLAAAERGHAERV